MSVLETFFIMFESDSADVSKGAAAANKVVKDLNKSLAATDIVSNKLGASFSNLIRQAGGALLASLSAGAIITGIKSAALYTSNLSQLSRALDVNIGELGAWGDAVKKSGGSIDGFQDTVRAVTGSLADFATKGTSRVAPFFSDLKIRMTEANGKARNFLEILPELAAAFEKISKKESFGIGQKMGLDQGTILLLQEGRKEVESLIKRQKELGLVTKEDAEIVDNFNMQWDDTEHAFRSLFITLGSSVIPSLTDLAKIFEQVAVFFRKHSDLIVGGLLAIAAAVTYFVTPAIIGAVTAFAPFLGIGAVIAGVAAAFALLYEDFKVFDEGGESLIGDIINKWPLVGNILKTLANLAYLVIEGVKGAASVLLDIFLKPLDGWNIFRAAVNKGVVELFRVFPKLKTFISDVWEAINTVIKLKLAKIMSIINTVVGLYETVKKALGFGESDTAKMLSIGEQAINSAGSSPLSAQTSNSIITSKANSRNTNVQISEITINTQADDANGIAGAIGGSLSTQMDQAANNFDDGVLA